MRINGETIIVTKAGEMSAARDAARKLSHSRRHSWATLLYIDSEYKCLTSETYSEGQRYSRGHASYVPWYNSRITVLDAMAHYGSPWIRRNAIRLGGQAKGQ